MDPVDKKKTVKYFFDTAPACRNERVNETSCIRMPAYITKKRSSRTTDNRYNYETSPDIKLPIIRPFGSSFFPSSIELWNCLPLETKTISQYCQFLTELKL